MRILDYLGYFVGIPAVLTGLLAFYYLLTKKSQHPATYQLGEPWTHEPVLWAATDEVIGDHRAGGHGQVEFSVGGGASGKW